MSKLYASRPAAPPTRLSTEMLNVLNLIIARPVMGFDRVSFVMDHPSPDIRLPLIGRHCNSITLKPCEPQKYHPMWQSHVDLFQPSAQALNLICQFIGNRYRVSLNYAEIAIDFLTETSGDAAEVHRFMLEHMTVPYLRHDVTHMGGTAYFAPRSMSSGTATPHNVVIYSDRPSKLRSVAYLCQPCCHLEHRLVGLAEMENHGFFSLTDCAQFDHEAFWHKNLHLSQLPAKVDLGRWLDPENSNVSGTALRKRADKFLDAYRYNGTLILQDCLHDNGDLKPLMRSIKSADFLAI